MLIDVPCSELAQELSQSRVAVQGLQNTLQQVLDQREEARQSKQLLELYLRALEKEGSILLKQQGRIHRLGSYTENSVEPLLEREPGAYHVVKNSETTAAGILRWQASVCPAACSGWMLVWLYVYMVCWSLSHICFAESKAGVGDERDAVDTGIGESSSEIALTSQILNALKEKPAPELSLSSKDLEVGKHQGPWPLQGEACIRFFSPLQTLNH